MESTSYTGCNVCIFYYFQDDAENSSQKGECRRKPPSMVMGQQTNPLGGVQQIVQSIYPPTQATLGCGDGCPKCTEEGCTNGQTEVFPYNRSGLCGKHMQEAFDATVMNGMPMMSEGGNVIPTLSDTLETDSDHL